MIGDPGSNPSNFPYGKYPENATAWTTTTTEDEEASIAERWLAAGERIAANLTVCAWCLGILVALSALNLLLDVFGWPV